MNRKPILWAMVVLIAVMAALSAWVAPHLPDRVPMHFNFAGDPDRLGSRAEALLVLPLTTLGLGTALWLLPLVFPRRQNLALSARGYNAVGVGGMAFLAVMHAALLLNGLGHAVAMGRLVPLAAGLLMILIGNYLPKTRSNWLFGIRLPWTLDSERSWAKTHRLGGRLFLLLGVVVAAMALITPPPVTAFTLAAGCAALVLVLLVYSYRQWRLDPACHD